MSRGREGDHKAVCKPKEEKKERENKRKGKDDKREGKKPDDFLKRTVVLVF